MGFHVYTFLKEQYLMRIKEFFNFFPLSNGYIIFTRDATEFNVFFFWLDNHKNTNMRLICKTLKYTKKKKNNILTLKICTLICFIGLFLFLSYFLQLLCKRPCTQNLLVRELSHYVLQQQHLSYTNEFCFDPKTMGSWLSLSILCNSIKFKW